LNADAPGHWVYKVESVERHPKWNSRRAIRLQSWRRSALKHQTVCQRDTVKIFVGRIRSLCALDSRLLPSKGREVEYG